MERTSPPGIKLQFNKPFLLEALLFCLLCAITILDWLAHLALNQDSSTYITVASSILKTGRLFYYVNSTNFVNTPGLNPFTDQPPGFPYLLVPFLAVLRDPIIAAAVAQSLYLVFLLAAVWLLAVQLKFPRLLRMVALVLFTFIVPFTISYRHFLTETLFIALSLAAASFAIRVQTGPFRRSDWVLFSVLVALSAMVRYFGVANMVLIAPLIFRMETPRAAWRLFVHKYTMAGILVFGAGLMAVALLSDLRPGAIAGLGQLQLRGIMIGGLALITGTCGLWLSRKGGAQETSTVEGGDSARRIQLEAQAWPVLAGVITALPILIWFTRNTVFFGTYSRFIRPLSIFYGERLWGPPIYIWTDLLNYNSLLRPFLLVLIVLLLWLPFWRTSSSVISSFRKSAHVILVCAFAGELAFIWFLSLVAHVTDVRERLFNPILAFLVFALLNGAARAVESISNRGWKIVLQLVPLTFLVFGGVYSPTEFVDTAGTVNYPRERQLWSELAKIDWIHTASYFYTDDAYGAGGYIHQIFAGIPQGLLWDPNIVRDAKVIRNILSDGVNPFIIVRENGPDDTIFDRMSARGTLPMEKITFQDVGFVLYTLPRK
jgi:hypothetical protein